MDDTGGYTWEAGNKHSWKDLEEGGDQLQKIDSGEAPRKKPKRKHAVVEQACVQRGMIRYVILVVDCSAAMKEVDFKPSRFAAAVELVRAFVAEFLDQNPLCQLSLVVSYDATATALTEMSGIRHHHDKVLQSIHPSGEFSLQNSLILAAERLQTIPSYGHREVIVLHAASRTCDPSDIFREIAKLKTLEIRCSVVSLVCEVYVFRKLTEETNGKFAVSTSKRHLRDLLFKHVQPLPSLLPVGQTPTCNLIEMGFPVFKKSLVPTLAIASQKFNYEGYHCPRCHTKVEDLPTPCPVCGLALVRSDHLARSYHHLFPVPKFKELSAAVVSTASPRPCFGCKQNITVQTDDETAVQCPACSKTFCADCDEFVHSTLHVCPGCESLQHARTS